ncbi:hypothetical protein IE53DRAFT_211493 [Violaceomyces palustris]|uniref:Uncharacterized protein n=1 Tax=Violaceomyces palustris TaxID=1673888 RepID=A0ACD0NQQ9_9BASI|nr:hypothetical protein IE53DRAFT_211493 [Violaceomyces palustris]
MVVCAPQANELRTCKQALHLCPLRCRRTRPSASKIGWGERCPLSHLKRTLNTSRVLDTLATYGQKSENRYKCTHHARCLTKSTTGSSSVVRRCDSLEEGCPCTVGRHRGEGQRRKAKKWAVERQISNGWCCGVKGKHDLEKDNLKEKEKGFPLADLND